MWANITVAPALKGLSIATHLFYPSSAPFVLNAFVEIFSVSPRLHEFAVNLDTTVCIASTENPDLTAHGAIRSFTY